MKEPTRLTRSGGPASELMRGSGLHVPEGARRRALQFTKVAVGVTASGTAAAAVGAAPLVKSLVITISLGALGGGLASLGVSKVMGGLEQPVSTPGVSAPVRTPHRPSASRAPAALELSSPSAPQVGEPAPAIFEAAVPAPTATTPSTETALPVAKAPAAVTAEPSAELAGKARRPSVPSASAPGRNAASRPSLFEEQRMIESARAAVARGDASTALTLLDQYERQYSPKQFGPEALALRVQAQAVAGRSATARSLAKEFAQKYPHHPLLPGVQSTVGQD